MELQPVSVLHLVPELGYGGTEGMLLDLLSRLDPSLFRCTIAVLGEAGDADRRRSFERAGVRTVRLPFRLAALSKRSLRPPHLRAQLRVTRQLYRYLRATRPHIVHTHGPQLNLYGVLAARAASVPHVMTHDHDPVGRGWRERLALNSVTRWADVAFVDSRTLGDARRTLLRAGTERILQLPNGVDLHRFRPPTDAERVIARQQLGVPEEAFVIGATGRFVPSKRHDLLLEALPAVLSRLPHARLLLVGDGTERQALLALARRLGVHEQVQFAGWLPDIVPAYWALDLFACLNDEREGFGVRIAEAMACGRPIVARRSPVLEEILGAETAHWVTADAERVATSIVWLARSEGDRARLSEQARAHAALYLDIDIGAQRLEDVYAHCVARTPRPWAHRQLAQAR